MGDLQLIAGLAGTGQRFLWHASTRTAVVADLHLGIGITLAREGMTLPDTWTGALSASWESVLERRPATVVIAGDLFDSPTPEQSTVAEAARMLAAVPTECQVVITPGNHDPAPLPDLGRKVMVRASVQLAPGIVASHGHTLAEEWGSPAGAVWIVGHQHPAVTIASRVRSAKMPCFALCAIAGGHLLIVPAFSRAPLGSNLLTERHWLLPVPRPGNEQVRIAGIVERGPTAQVLDFGLLSGLATP